MITRSDALLVVSAAYTVIIVMLFAMVIGATG